MDEQLVLTAQTLKLNPDLRRADVEGDVFVIKNVPARKYLTLSVEQWNLLRNFANPATVPDVLRAVILNRTCVPLREYYELVLKAHRTGILHMAQQTEPEVRASRWFLSVNAWICIFLTVVAAGVAGFALATHPFPLPGDWLNPALLNLSIGWGLLSLGLSLGQLLAASVLHSGGGEVYQPRFHLLRPIPYFGVRLDDACMTSRATQVGVSCARLLAVFATAAVLWMRRPEWGTLHVAVIVWMLRPFGNGCVPLMISTLCRGAVLDTQKNFLFSLNKRWRVRVKSSLSRLSLLYVTARVAWGVAWIALLVFMLLRAFDEDVAELFGSIGYWEQVALVFCVMAGAAIVAYFALPATRVIWVTLVERCRRLARSYRRWRVNVEETARPEQISRLLSESLLFRRVPPGERTVLMQMGMVKTYKGYQVIQRFSDHPNEVAVILSGRVLVYRRTNTGRAERAITLVEGDVYGLHAMLDPGRQQVQIKTLTPVVALVLPLSEFETRVLRPLTAPVVHDLLHKVPFLRGVSFCSTWHPQAMARFASLASIVSYNEGEVIVAEKQESHQFYVVYEGLVHVKRRNRVRGRLRPGAFFGEISILQNSAAVSDVVAREPSRCLTISRADFLRFVTHNPVVSLQLEEISSRRLGRPIFPLSGTSFDVR